MLLQFKLKLFLIQNMYVAIYAITLYIFLEITVKKFSCMTNLLFNAQACLKFKKNVVLCVFDIFLLASEESFIQMVKPFYALRIILYMNQKRLKISNV